MEKQRCFIANAWRQQSLHSEKPIPTHLPPLKTLLQLYNTKAGTEKLRNFFVNAWRQKNLLLEKSIPTHWGPLITWLQLYKNKAGTEKQKSFFANACWLSAPPICPHKQY
eukprot:11371991-Ditylum_brightwellii.AAC.1